MSDADWELDWGAEQRAELAAGVYLAEVREAEKTISKKGNKMYKLRLVAPAFAGKALCYEYLTVDGPGAGIGLKKLRLLGFSESDGTPQTRDMLGRRCYVSVSPEAYNGKVSLKVDPDAYGEMDECFFGWWSTDGLPSHVLPEQADGAIGDQPPHDDYGNPGNPSEDEIPFENGLDASDFDGVGAAF